MGKKKEEGGDVGIELPQRQKGAIDDFNKELDELSKSDFKKFKGGIIGHLKTLFEGIIYTQEACIMGLEKTKDNIKEIIEGVSKRNRDYEEIFDAIREEMDKLQTLCFAEAIQNATHRESSQGALNDDRRRMIAEACSLDFDGMVNYFIHGKAPDLEGREEA